MFSYDNNNNNINEYEGMAFLKLKSVTSDAKISK